MKKLLFVSLITVLWFSNNSCAQADKSQRPSPPAKATETLANGLTVTIDYSQPSVKGRTIGKDIAPYGKVWRTGANEATTITLSRDAKVNGKALAAGKYSIYSIPGEKEWIMIFNKTWNQWGTKYSDTEDALRVSVVPDKAGDFYEKMTFGLNKEGLVNLWWGNTQVRLLIQ